jgi:Spy/CpxP family protein refolding chaperone
MPTAVSPRSLTTLRLLCASLVLAAAAVTLATVVHAKSFDGPAPAGFLGAGPLHGRALERLRDGGSSQIRGIAEAAQNDLKAQFETGRGLRAQGLQLLSAPTLDDAAAENLRQQMLAQHDQASRRMLQAMLDIGRVLTPEQRARLGEQLAKHADMARRGHGERAERAPTPTR